MKRLNYNDMPTELQELHNKYADTFGLYPDRYEELDGPCSAAYDPKVLREALEKNIELPELVLGKDYWKDRF